MRISNLQSIEYDSHFKQIIRKHYYQTQIEGDINYVQFQDEIQDDYPLNSNDNTTNSSNYQTINDVLPFDFLKHFSLRFFLFTFPEPFLYN